LHEPNEWIAVPMDFDRRKLVACSVSAVLWLMGLSAFVFLFDLELMPVAAVYYLVFTLAISSRRVRTELALLAGWAVAVLAMGVLIGDGEVGGRILSAAVSGTFLAAGWVFTSFLVLLLIDADLRKVSS
jgi:hypothetical protein